MRDWNYRIVVKTTEDGDHYYGIHEVYYNAAGWPNECSETPCDPFGETKKELQDNVNQMAEAFTMPILHYDDILEAMDGAPEFMYTVANQETDAARQQARFMKESPWVASVTKDVREVVNELYRSSYLDHYAKKKILEVVSKRDSFTWYKGTENEFVVNGE